MEIRLAHPNEVDRILEIIADGRRYIAKTGSDQWQNGYPDREVIIDDILNGYGQVAVVDGQVAAYVALTGHDPAYDQLLSGAWTNPEKRDYLTFHRLAVGEAYRGQEVALALLEGLMEVRQSREFRADTHQLNQATQGLLINLGFVHIGQALLPDGERLAYEKVAN